MKNLQKIEIIVFPVWCLLKVFAISKKKYFSLSWTKKKWFQENLTDRSNTFKNIFDLLTNFFFQFFFVSWCSTWQKFWRSRCRKNFFRQHFLTKSNIFWRKETNFWENFWNFFSPCPSWLRSILNKGPTLALNDSKSKVIWLKVVWKLPYLSNWPTF